MQRSHVRSWQCLCGAWNPTDQDRCGSCLRARPAARVGCLIAVALAALAVSCSPLAPSEPPAAPPSSAPPSTPAPTPEYRPALHAQLDLVDDGAGAAPARVHVRVSTETPGAEITYAWFWFDDGAVRDSGALDAVHAFVVNGWHTVSAAIVVRDGRQATANRYVWVCCVDPVRAR
jgi:hypothetical protein